jgi:hypothetical protein
MKMLFWIGLAVLILGVASLVVPIPRNESDSFKVGGMSVGVETQHSEKRQLQGWWNVRGS